jgi:Dynein heavy chain AAA lid domain
MFPFIRKKCKEMVSSVDNNLVTSCLNLLETFLSTKGLDLKKTAANLQFPNKAVMTYLCFSIIWSLGANLHDSSRPGFIEAIRA